VTTRRATPEDAQAIAEVEVAAWRAAYGHLMPVEYLDALSVDDKARTWATDLEKHGLAGRKRTHVAIDGGSVVGFSLAGIPMGAEPGSGLLYFLYVAQPFWGTGLARELMDAVTADFIDQGITTGYLWVLADNGRARRFYERTGWRTDGETTMTRYGRSNLRSVRYYFRPQAASRRR
jgi:ribosomal protein S18 acetylase RimI-like enzyme